MGQDLKFKEAITWRLGMVGPFANPAVFVIAQRFASNLERVEWAAKLLPWLVGKATLYQDASTRVLLAASQQERDDPEFNTKSQSKIHERANADEAACFADEALGFKRDKQALNVINFLLANYNHPKVDGTRNELLIGFDALFESMLIGAWTAIEITLEDLWDEAGKLPVGKNLDKKHAARRIPDLVQSVRMEAPEQQDRIDRFSGKWKSFRTLLAARVAYSCRFHDNSTDIDNALSSLDLDALALIRNVIVHSASKPDAPFRNQARGIPGLQQWADPELLKIEFDGEVIRDLIESALKSTAALMLAVDHWIELKL